MDFSWIKAESFNCIACAAGRREYKMNTIIEALKTRRSVRKYKPDMVPQEIIDQIIDAGLYAASGHGEQKPIIVSVTNKELRDEISVKNCEIGGWSADVDPLYGAPVVLIVLAPKDWPNRVYDGSLVIGNLMQAADALGIGSCWIHRAREEFESDWGKELLKKIGLKGEWEGIGHCILGYPEDNAKPKAAPRMPGRVYYVK